MEEARSLRFFNSQILFSLIYDEYEKNLKREIWLCHKHMSLSLTELDNMPIQDRKYFVSLHNKGVEEEKAQYQSMKSSNMKR